jgi:hypothetical protein
MSQIGNVYAGEDPAIDPSLETLYTFQAPPVTLFDPPHTHREAIHNILTDKSSSTQWQIN